jgi:hypothetical protein
MMLATALLAICLKSLPSIAHSADLDNKSLAQTTENVKKDNIFKPKVLQDQSKHERRNLQNNFTIIPNATSDDMMNVLFRDIESPILTRNAAFNGDYRCAALFTGGKTAVPDESINFPDVGFVLSTGDAYETLRVGNNSTEITTNLDSPGDPDFETDSNKSFDACSFEFEFRCKDSFAPGSILALNYTFGSDEYIEQVQEGLGFADSIGIFLNGQNLALIPGTNETVDVYSVSDENNTEYFVFNDPRVPTPKPYPFFQPDGFTQNLYATGLFKPQWNTLKIGLADIQSFSLDSYLFINAVEFECFTVVPSDVPSSGPSFNPSDIPSSGPSFNPSDIPSSGPASFNPSDIPSSGPSFNPSDIPSPVPTNAPIAGPSKGGSNCSKGKGSKKTKAPKAGPSKGSSKSSKGKGSKTKAPKAGPSKGSSNCSKGKGSKKTKAPKAGPSKGSSNSSKGKGSKTKAPKAGPSKGSSKSSKGKGSKKTKAPKAGPSKGSSNSSKGTKGTKSSKTKAPYSPSKGSSNGSKGIKSSKTKTT